MDIQRLNQIEEIYHAALKIADGERKEFIRKTCDTDPELRREIESLLKFVDMPDSFLETPPKSLAAEMFADLNNQKILINREISHYKIIKLLGKGGMGEVYLAEDTKLDRNVAIKFMDKKFIEEKSNLNRFFFEAKSSSALNHPNIITVYEIGEFENSPFIVTEFIDGITLKKYLAENKPALGEILDVAIQIASALSTAHKAGIIHRDIKPDNVMIRQDGIVKILDFGLAKYDSTAIDAEANTRARISTVHGMIMGTPHFMSPEQARGKTVGTRTDIWSFGVLFYLMLTNNLPFQGETTSDVIAAILKSEPLPIKDSFPHISPTLENVILKTFRKNQNERPKKIDEILIELKNYRRIVENEQEAIPLNYRITDDFDADKHTDTSLIHTTAKDPSVYPNKPTSIFSQTIGKAKKFPVFVSLFGIAFVSLIVVLGIGISRSNLFSKSKNSFQEMKLEKLTYDGLAADAVAVSPDGKFVVYVLEDEKKQTLMVRQIASSTAAERIPPADVVYTGLAFTPDGNDIYYTVREKSGGTLFDIPVVGGSPRKILENIDGKVSFSPDGKTMAFTRSRTLLMTADINGGSEKLLAKSLPQEIRVLAEWSPNGETIMTSGFSTEKSSHFLAEISVKDGTEKRFTTTAWQSINGLRWLPDGSGIMMSGRDPEIKFSQIWSVSYPDGKASRITNDFSTYTDLGLTAENNSLVAVKEERTYNLWASRADSPRTAKKITYEEGKDDGTSGVVWTPDGKIVYTVRPTSLIEIWIANADGTEKRRLTNNQAMNYSPVVSPDGRYIVFTSTRTENNEIWRMDIDGGNPVQLTDTKDEENIPNFTPDGKWIIYQRKNADRLTTIWKVSSDGGNPIQLTKIQSRRLSVSPDGKVFVCNYGEPQSQDAPKLSIISIEDGTPLKTLDLPLVANSRMFRWSSDGKALIYLENKNRVSNLWSQEIENNSLPKQLTFLESGRIADFCFTRNGKNLIVSRGNESSDIVMMSNFR